MKKLIIVSVLSVSLLLTGCEEVDKTTIVSEQTEGIEQAELPTYKAEFYDNNGGMWFKVKGKQFDIVPNKVKMYGWNSDGSWVSYYEMSSVMSIYIDGLGIESCGSTVIFADSRLEKHDVDIPVEVATVETANDEVKPLILQPSDLRAEDWIKLQYWWSKKTVNNKYHGKRIVIIMSQAGAPICMYMGDNVSWDIPRNLPKTTSVLIDGKAVYIHRTNFAIIDADLLNRSLEEN